ncbi:MAG: glycosyltransferase [Candidatus Eisenbacteria bacterium]|nr:glycosyltransferase [Candidatus Eisenbacteria bacterium]
MSADAAAAVFPVVSVVIPARNEEARIGRTVRAALEQRPEGTELEAIVVDDGSTDGTIREAERAGARVVGAGARAGGGPAAARNRGAEASRGDPILFLDADCVPEPGWLRAMLDGHRSGAEAVGGPLVLPPGESISIRSDYYGCCYHMHPRRRRGPVRQHSPCNLSVRRGVFLNTARFDDRRAVRFAHEELSWQGELAAAGGTILFEPAARARFSGRPGFRSVLARSYRWGRGAAEAKAGLRIVRWSRLYRHPRLVAVAGVPLGALSFLYVMGCWLRAGTWEPLLLWPLLFLQRAAYAAGLARGGLAAANLRADASPRPLARER